MINDALGDRMKMYENAEAGRKLMPLLPVMARIDGRSFHNFTRGLLRPYDTAFSNCMIETTFDLVSHTGAAIGYTQSDEISLAWHSDNHKSQIWFDGRIAKMTSQLAAQATVIFYRNVQKYLPYEYAERLPTFDARVWNVPTRTEGANVFLWREMDATKNSISMAAHANFSHKCLQGKNGSEKQELLFQKGINWNDYPAFFKRGTFIQKRTIATKFTTSELERLPAKHAARSNPDLIVERQMCCRLDMPPFGSVINREAVIFDGAEPKIA